MQIQATVGYCLPPVTIAMIKKTKIANAHGDVEKGNPCDIHGNVNSHSHYGKQYGDSPKIKNRTII